MRLLFWSELFLPDIGGVEVWSAQLIRALQRRGHECLAVACHGPSPASDSSSFDGIPVHRFRFHDALLRKDLAAIKQLVADVAELKRGFQPDVVHVNSSQPSVMFHERSVDAVTCSTLVTVHEPPIVNVRNSMLARLLQRADWVVGVSRAMLDDARTIVPEVTAKSSVIYNAVDDATKDFPQFDLRSRELFCVGRLVREKGFDNAIRALKDVLAEYPDARLTIVGDGPERSNLERLAADTGVSASVSFTGWVAPENIGTLLRSAFVVLMPSRWREPFGLVALQAAEAGRPVVASCVGGLAEIVLDGATGSLVAPDDPHALARAVKVLLAEPAKTARMGAAARRDKRSRFDYGRFVTAYEQLYRRLGERRATRGARA